MPAESDEMDRAVVPLPRPPAPGCAWRAVDGQGGGNQLAGSARARDRGSGEPASTGAAGPGEMGRVEALRAASFPTRGRSLSSPPTSGLAQKCGGGGIFRLLPRGYGNGQNSLHDSPVRYTTQLDPPMRPGPGPAGWMQESLYLSAFMSLRWVGRTPARSLQFQTGRSTAARWSRVRNRRDLLLAESGWVPVFPAEALAKENGLREQ